MAQLNTVTLRSCYDVQLKMSLLQEFIM